MEASALIGSQLKRRADYKSARLWLWVLHQIRLTSSNLMTLSIHQPDTKEVLLQDEYDHHIHDIIDPEEGIRDI